MRPVALVGAITPSYVRATTPRDLGPIDLDRARQQHAAYVEALEGLGYAIHHVAVDADSPDAVFVEDQAVVVGRRALVTRSGHPGRRGEAEAVAAALQACGLDVVRMPAGATLDGGDVLPIGDRLWVGASHRSNDAGIAFLASVFPERRVAAVPVPEGTLHLKCTCTSPVPGVIVIAEGAPEIPFDPSDRVVRVPREEAWAANVLGRGDRVLVGAGWPRTEAGLRALGLDVVLLEMSEIRKGDGSLTCLSIPC